MPKGTVEARPSRHAAGCFDAQSFLVEHGVRFQVHDGAGYRKLVLEECPFDASHKAPDAAVLVFDNGRIGFNCFHNGCANRTWRDVRQHYDPTAYERAAYVSSCEQVRKAEATSDGDLEESGLLDITKIPFEDRSKTLYVRTGIPELNRMLGGADCGFAKGEVTVWTGANGSGKSTLISQMALESAAEGYHVAIFTGELSPGRAKAWLYLQAAGHDGVYRDGDSDFWSVEDTMKLAISRALEGRVFIYPNEKGTAVDAVLGRIQKHMKDHPVDVIILDNMMVLDKGDGMDKYDAQLRIMKAVVEFTRVNNVHVHFVCHPRKQSGLISRYDISGTADISNLAANIIAVYRNGDEFRAAWAQSKQGEVAPNSDNLLQLLKCRSDGEHVGEILPLYFDTCCKVMSAARGGRRNYPWQEGVKPEQMLIDVSGMADPDFPFVDGGAQ